MQARRAERSVCVDNHRAACPLAGLVRCARCGRNLIYQGKNKGVPYLRCPTKGCCAGAKYDLVEQALLARLEGLMESVPVSAPPEPPDGPELAAVRRRTALQFARLAERRERLYRLVEEGVYSPTLFSQRMQALERDAQALELAAANAEAPPPPPEPERTALDCWRAAGPAGKRALLRTLIREIVYEKEKKTKPAEFSLTVILRDFS